MNRVLVTGGAGFLGSHLAEALLNKGMEVSVVDRLTSGSLGNIEQCLSNPRLRFHKEDILHMKDDVVFVGCDTVFHLAANPEVRDGYADPSTELQQNLLTTQRVLEHMRKTEGCERIVFSSSSTVYGEPEAIPTPESYGPLNPISVYGATKLACEALVSAYCHSYGLKGVVFRLANIVGPRARRGVVLDFIAKLSKNPHELEVLGDGTQRKSYLHVRDAVSALLFGLESLRPKVTVFNAGSKDALDVLTIAKMVTQSLHLKQVRFKLSGGVDGGRGWYGDVKTMLLDTSKIERLGWRPTMGSETAVRVAAKELIGGIDTHAKLLD